jgi:hypothetical protein
MRALEHIAALPDQLSLLRCEAVVQRAVELRKSAGKVCFDIEAGGRRIHAGE